MLYIGSYKLQCRRKSSCIFIESNVNLYRYGGFTLDSMIRKRLAHKTKITTKNELDLLEHLKVTKEKWGQLPAAILELKKGGLVVPSPTLLPFLRKVVERTSACVNERKCMEHGRKMIELTKEELDNE